MTSPTRSVAVRLSLDPSSYIRGAARAEASTVSLERAVSKVGPTSATSMEKAAASTAKAEGAFGKLNKTAGALGLTMGGLAGVGAAVGAAMSVKWAGDYQSALTRLVTTAGESPKNIKSVGQAFLDMAGQVGISADEIAKGAYTAESAGFHGAAAVTVMKAATQGARQENADLGKVVNATTTILHDYHLGASDAARVTSQLITAVSHGKVSFDELTGALDAITPLAARANISIADVTGTLAAMTASGMSADQATQNMQNTLLHLVNPTNTMIAELSQLGISTDDLANSLSTKGLAGTLQMVEEAIVKHVDPATQRVLLPALNKSKSAAQDLQVMLGQMPPTLAKMSRGLMDGTTSFKDYRKAVQDMGGPSSAMGKQFMTLYESSQGFNNVLKAGGPNAQVFTAAMAKAFGTTSALNVALQTTGENAGATNAAIKDIAKAAGDAQGNIKGWDEVQGNFNQQLAQAEAHMKSMAIEAGQHLLPLLTSTFGYVNRDVLPGLEHLGSIVGDVAHWFGELPGPIRDAAGALAAMALANKIGLLGSLEGAVSRAATAFGGFRAEMAQNGKAATLASRSLGGLKAAGSGLMGLFGGPWGLAIAGATLGLTALSDAVQRHDAQIKTATRDVQEWNKAISLGGGGQSAVDAAQHLDDLRSKLAAVTEKINEYNAAAQQGYARGGVGSLVQQQKELQGELDKGTKAWKDQLAAMTPVQEAQARVDIAMHDLNMAMKDNPPNSQAVSNASMRLHDAQAALAGETERANRAQRTQIQNLQDQANAILGSLDAQRAAQVAQLQLGDAIASYNQGLADGSLKGNALKEAQLGLVDSAEQAAKAAGDAAAKQAAQNGATDTGTASQAAFLKSLQASADQMTGPAKQAVLDLIKQMAGQQRQAILTAGAVSGLGATVTNLPNSHMIEIDAPTDKQMQKLQDLGYEVVHLPNGKVVITADVHPAQQEIVDLLNYARQQSINYRATLPDLNGAASGTGRMGTYATGGYTGDGGKYTPAGIVHAGEFVFPQESVRKLGVGFLGALAGLPGYASGGWVNVPPGGWYAGSAAVPTHVQDAGYKAGLHSALAAAASAFTPGAPGNVSANAALAQRMAARYYGWTGPEWNALYALWMRESGFRNTAQNPTSTAFGIPQFLDSTWATVGVSKTSNPAVQIAGGLKYIANRFHDPIGAWRHEQQYGWYKDGTDFVPFDMPAYLHKGEAVVPATENARVRSREVSGGGYSGRGSALNVTITGARISGTVAMDPKSGLLSFVDARIDQAIGEVHDAVHYGAV